MCIGEAEKAGFQPQSCYFSGLHLMTSHTTPALPGHQTTLLQACQNQKWICISGSKRGLCYPFPIPPRPSPAAMFI